MGRSKMTLNNSNKSMKTKKQWKNQNLLAVLTFFFFSVESLFTTRILQGCSDGRRVIFVHNAAWSHLGRGWEGEGETAGDEESRELKSLRSSEDRQSLRPSLWELRLRIRSTSLCLVRLHPLLCVFISSLSLLLKPPYEFVAKNSKRGEFPATLSLHKNLTDFYDVMQYEPPHMIPAMCHKLPQTPNNAFSVMRLRRGAEAPGILPFACAIVRM